ncbi:MAG: winged helix-turn-helix domain-containing protein [Archaeoglobaceae archaeon]
MVRRSRYEIFFCILKLCDRREGAGITRIVYGCNLNFKSADEYIQQLVEAEMLEEVGVERRTYRTTEKGKEFCRKFEGIML